MKDIKTKDPLSTLTVSKPGRFERCYARVVLLFEDLIKVPIFRCQRCGECILSHTGFVCSQRCPKRLRNGPCGGTGEHGECEVYPERKCIWAMAYRRAKLLGRTSLLSRMEKNHNWELEHSSAWVNLAKKRIEPPVIWIKRKQ
jgi:hypothetical protein